MRLTKPLFAMSSSIGVIFSARLIDRVGKGIRGAPRDALVADLAPPQLRGAAFGLRQSLDTVGAFLGPLLAVALMLVWANDFRAVFWVAVIPGALAVALLIFGVSEPERADDGTPRTNPIRWANLQRLGAPYWWVVIVGACFTLARFSEAFLVLRAQQGGLRVAWVPLVMVAMNVVYALAAYPFGRLSDRIEPRPAAEARPAACWSRADLVLASSNHWSVVVGGVAALGAAHGHHAGTARDDGGGHRARRPARHGVRLLQSGQRSRDAGGERSWPGCSGTSSAPAATFYAGAVFCVLTLLGAGAAAAARSDPADVILREMLLPAMPTRRVAAPRQDRRGERLGLFRIRLGASEGFGSWTLADRFADRVQCPHEDSRSLWRIPGTVARCAAIRRVRAAGDRRCGVGRARGESRCAPARRG